MTEQEGEHGVEHQRLRNKNRRRSDMQSLSQDSIGRARIALAEDNDEMRGILAAQLRGDGYDVVETGNGLELIGAIVRAGRQSEQPKFDLIVSDIRMPEMSGLRFLAELRKHDRDTPVVLITAFGDEKTRGEAQQFGVGAVLDKPFELEDFRRLVRQFVPHDRFGVNRQAM